MVEEFLVYAEVDLDAIAHNVAAIKRYVGDKVEVLAVVKANAYGHGLRQVAQVALDNGASRLVLNHIQAAVTLRNAGFTAPVLVMGYIPPAAVRRAIENDLVLTVSSKELAETVSRVAVGLGTTVKVHVKVDTGMGRFGLTPEEAVPFAQWLTTLPGVFLEGVYTHFATADVRDKSYVYEQLVKYEGVLDALTASGVHVPVRHVANSAVTLSMPQLHMDAVRPGVALYGLYPSDEVEHTVDLWPALSLRSRVGRLRTLLPGESVSYRRTFIAQKPTPVALVPCGYGDGYMRLTSNRGAVLIRGKRAPIRGRVCMDQLVVDISGIDDVRLDDEAVLIGRQGNDRILADEVAAWAETINYEVVTHLLPRVPRVYRQNGEIVSVMEGWQ